VKLGTTIPPSDEPYFSPNPYNPESGIVGTFRYTPKSSR